MNVILVLVGVYLTLSAAIEDLEKDPTVVVPKWLYRVFVPGIYVSNFAKFGGAWLWNSVALFLLRQLLPRQ